MSLHVLQLGPVPPPEGGVSRHIQVVRRELIERGHRCSLVATSRSRASIAESDVYHPRTPLDLLRTVRSLTPDVVHLHLGGNINGRLIALALAVVRLADRSVLTIHSGAYPLSQQARRARPRSVHGRAFAQFSHLIAVNDALADVFARYGLSDDKISTIPPYALDLPNESIELPRRITEFIGKHSPLLLSVGGLERDYDPLFQIKALDELRDTLPNAGLIIVGDGSERDQVLATVERQKLQAHVMLAGDLDHQSTLNLIRRSDVMLRTTLFDGDAISIHEAQFLGTPVIATDVAPRPAGVKLIPVGDSKALLEKVTKLTNGHRTKSPIPDKADTSNIRAVVDLYENLG